MFATLSTPLWGPAAACLHSPVSTIQMLKSLLIMAQNIRRWLSASGKTVKCPWPAADSRAPHRSSVPGHPPEAGCAVRAADAGLGQVCPQSAKLHCVPARSFMPVLPSRPVPTHAESRPCLQVASCLSWAARHTQPLLEVSVSPSRQSECPSVMVTLGTCPRSAAVCGLATD